MTRARTKSLWRTNMNRNTNKLYIQALGPSGCWTSYLSRNIPISFHTFHYQTQIINAHHPNTKIFTIITYTLDLYHVYSPLLIKDNYSRPTGYHVKLMELITSRNLLGGGEIGIF